MIFLSSLDGIELAVLAPQLGRNVKLTNGKSCLLADKVGLAILAHFATNAQLETSYCQQAGIFSVWRIADPGRVLAVTGSGSE